MIATVKSTDQPGTIVATFTATDDEGDTFTWALLQDASGGYFAMDRTTGVLTIAKSLQDLSVNPATLVIQATDTGKPMGGPKSSTVEVTAQIVIASLVAPDVTFVHVPENLPVGEKIGTNLLDEIIKANPQVDLFGGSAVITVDEYDAFDIADDFLVVADSTPLNYEVQPSLNIKYAAKLGDLPSTEGTIHINLDDRNDPPKFARLAYQATVGHGGQTFIRMADADILCTDEDIPRQAIIYNLVNNFGGRFDIQHDTGRIMVRTNSLAPNEQYTLNVTCTDNAGDRDPREWSRATLALVVTGTPAAPQSSGDPSSNSGLVAGVVILVLVAVILLVAFVVLYRRR